MRRTGLTVAVLVVAVGLVGCTSPETRREESLNAADVAAVQGDLERAVEILRLVQGYDPRDPVVTTLLGQTYEKLGRFNRALRLIEDFPAEVDKPSWINLRARLLFSCGRYQEGARVASALEQRADVEAATVEVLSDIVVERRLGPEDIGSLPEAWLSSLVERLLSEGSPITALAWMEQLPQGEAANEELLDAFMEHAMASNDPAFVRRVWTLLEPENTDKETLVHRRLLSLKGKNAAVARLDARFLARFPDHPERGGILVAEAHRRLARGESDEALRLVGEALSLDGSDVPALVLKGLVLQWSGRTEEAEIALRTVLAFDPGNQRAREALRTMEKKPEAVIMRIEPLP